MLLYLPSIYPLQFLERIVILKSKISLLKLKIKPLFFKTGSIFTFWSEILFEKI